MGDDAEKRTLLENSRLFKSFGPEAIDSILPILIPCSFDGDTLICLKGDESDCLFVIREGTVEVTVSSSDGKIILLGVLGPGDVFGEVGLIDKESRTANVTAINNVKLYRLNSSDFDNVTKTFGVDEWMALTSYICFLFRGVTNNLEETVFLDGSLRIAKKIQNLYKKNEGDADGNAFSIAISQENLGRMAGLSREATNKALSQLESQGLIERQYKRITVPDVKKFVAVLEDEDI